MRRAFARLAAGAGLGAAGLAARRRRRQAQELRPPSGAGMLGLPPRSTASTTASPPSSAGTPSASSPRSGSTRRARAPIPVMVSVARLARRRAAAARSPPTTARCPRPAPKGKITAPRSTTPFFAAPASGRAGAGAGLANMSAVMPAYQPRLSLVVLLAHVGGLAPLRHEPAGGIELAVLGRIVGADLDVVVGRQQRPAGVAVAGREPLLLGKLGQDVGRHHLGLAVGRERRLGHLGRDRGVAQHVDVLAPSWRRSSPG